MLKTSVVEPAPSIPIEDKIQIVLEGIRGEESIANLFFQEGMPNNLHYRWSKYFLEAVTANSKRMILHSLVLADLNTIIEMAEKKSWKNWIRCKNL